MLYYQGILYVPKVIYSKLINKYNNDLFVSHFGIKNTQELIVRKYNELMLLKNVKANVKGYNVCLASNIVCHKPYKDF